jgi:arginine-tRNA-protein transferase
MHITGAIYQCGPCPYLPGREFHAFQPDDSALAASLYRQLMDLRFRRSGAALYAPVCPGCDACRPIRVDTAAFLPRRDQRRCAARNADLTVTWQNRGWDQERADLYARYQAQVHDRTPGEDTADSLATDGGIPGGELHARDASGRLVAVSVCDRFADALSSVYCYWDPDFAPRRLGTFMALAEIAFCRQQNLPWLYLGYLVEACGKMAYKARFLPHDVLIAGQWVRHD